MIEMLNHTDRHDMMMRCDELAEREWEQSKEEGRRIGFLKLIFSQEEKSTQRAIRFDSECRDIFDGCYVAGGPSSAASSLVEQASHPAAP